MTDIASWCWTLAHNLHSARMLERAYREGFAAGFDDYARRASGVHLVTIDGWNVGLVDGLTDGRDA
jgi:hypothetical protein